MSGSAVMKNGKTYTKVSAYPFVYYFLRRTLCEQSTPTVGRLIQGTASAIRLRLLSCYGQSDPLPCFRPFVKKRVRAAEAGICGY